MNIPLGNSCPPGWTALVDPLLQQAQAEGAQVIQVKQKCGILRFYCDDASDALDDAITAAERKSATMCERCGMPGILRENAMGWLRTLCEEHKDYTRALPPESPSRGEP